MAQTALFVERDARYVPTVRKLRGTMTREEWDHPGHRQAAISAAWQHALAHIKQSDATAEFVSALPVTLFVSPLSGKVVIADIGSGRGAGHAPIWITASGQNRLLPPALEHLVMRRTTYASWAEGPLPHIEPEMLQAPTPTNDRELQRLRAQNPALKDLLDRSLSPSAYAAMPRAYTPETARHLVDFRIRGVFRVQDYRVLESKQSSSAKVLAKGGVLDLGEDGTL
jgi:hypothetical protein